ncbi:MAG: sigma-70 family RNA polymerase sigma factor [Verrucomicrobiota bacterium]|nr:sigma-70 family RNA polymerase sigma factor [Verrucomicrobiota bacterium]
MADVSSKHTAFSRDARFGETRWSVVRAARDGDSPAARQALAELCRVYWYPLYAFVRRSGHAPEEAEDLTQAFFARLLARDFLALVAPEKGRFRSFLLTAMKRFLVNEWHRATAKKRGGGEAPVPIDGAWAEDRYHAEPADPATPELLYERRWALTLLENVLAGLEAEYAGAGRAPIFEALQPMLAWHSGDQPYAAIAARLGLSEGAVKVAMYRLRRRYGDRLRAEIAQTVSSAEEVEDEIRRLFQIFAR